MRIGSGIASWDQTNAVGSSFALTWTQRARRPGSQPITVRRVEAPARGERGRTLPFPHELRPPPHDAGAPIVVIAMERCPEELWERLCRADPTCTFYQTPAWHRIAA